MAIRDVFQCVVLAAVCLSVPAEGQRLVVLPGAAATSATATVYTSEPFASAGTLNGAPGAFLVFSNPAGSTYFVVASSGVAVVDSAGAQIQSALSFAQPVTGAALTPDGSKLIVISGAASSGSISIFDATAATLGTPRTLALTGLPLDIATDLSSTKAYIVNSSNLTSVDLTQAAVLNAVSLAGLAPSGSAKPGLTVGPNGLVYVSAQAAIHEIHPETLATLKTIAVGGFSGRLSFSSDAKAAVVANQLSGSPIATVLNLADYTITSTLTGLGVRFDRVLFAAPDRIYATTPNLDRYLYSFSPSAPSSTLTPVLKGIASAAATSEYPLPHYLFAVDSTGTTRIDISAAATASIKVPLAAQASAGPAFYFPGISSGYGVSFAQYNAAQTLTPSATSLPLVVRLLDSNGQGASGQPVTWTSAPGVTLKSVTRTTDAHGYAVATAAVPAKVGVYSASASFPGTSLNSATFALTVGSSGGGGGGGLTSGISIVSGSGQAMFAARAATEPLVVSVADSAGNPITGASVTFAVQPGANSAPAGQFENPGTSTVCQYAVTRMTCPTDSKGQASVRFVGPALNPTTGAFLQSTIVASTPVASGNVTFYANTVPFASLSGTPNYLPTVTTIKPSTSNQITGVAGRTIQGAFEVLVRTQPITVVVPVSKIGLSIRSTSQYSATAAAPPAHCSDPAGIALSNAAGTATCNLVLGSQVGTYAIYRVVGGYDVQPYVLTITASPTPTPVPTTIERTTGEGLEAPVGQSVNLVGTVRDQTGKVMSGTTVSWSVVAGTATITPNGTKTDTNGQVSAAVTIGSAGAIQIRLAAGAASSIFHLTGAIPITGLSIVSGNQQFAVTGAAFAAPLVVQVNSGSVPAVSQTVTFAATGGATLSTSTGTTNANGQTSVTVTAGATAGTVQVTAASGGKSTTFSLTVRLPGPVLNPLESFLNGASFAKNFVSFGSVATIKTAGLTTGLDLAPGSCLTDGTIGGLPVTGGLPTRIAGVEFQFGSKLAPIFAICKNEDGTEQANVQVPFEVAPVKSWALVRYNAGTPDETEFAIKDMEVRNAAPGIFEYYVSSSALGAVARWPAC